MDLALLLLPSDHYCAVRNPLAAEGMHVKTFRYQPRSK